MPKKELLKLIKESGVTSISGDSTEAVKLVMYKFLTYVFEQLIENDSSSIETYHIKTFMSFYIEDEDRELPQELIIPSQYFQRGISELCNKLKCQVRREAIYVLGLFTECILRKIIKGANIIGQSSNRQRIKGKDIETSYQVYML